MTIITINCADPNDLNAITAAAEEAAGRCNITYAKHAAALIDAGTVKSERQAAEKIAEETGEKPDTVRKMIQRGKAKVETPVPKKQRKPKTASTPTTTPTPSPSPSSTPPTEQEVYEGALCMLQTIVKWIGEKHPGARRDKYAMLSQLHSTLSGFLSDVSATMVPEEYQGINLRVRDQIEPSQEWMVK